MKYYSVVVLAILFLVAVILNNVSPAAADVDSFYHLRHAWFYRTEGLLDGSFPWATQSIVKDIGADLWYGFHVLITPLTFFEDLVNGIRLGSVLTTFAALAIFYFALRRLKVRWPAFWTFLFLFSTADIMYRVIMFRPHPITAALSALFFAYLWDRPLTRATYFKIALIGFFVAWTHLSLAWILALVFTAVSLFDLLKKQLEWRAGLALISGVFLGWLARPNPFGVLKLAYIQIVQLMIEKSGNIPLVFGRELTPYVLENFIDQLIPFFIFLIVAGALLIWRREKMGSSGYASLLLCVIFIFWAFASARRAVDFFVPFGVIFLALAFTKLFPPEKYRHFNFQSSESILILIALIGLLGFMTFKTIQRFNVYMAHAFGPYQFQKTALETKDLILANSIIFHPSWDQFAQLFFWNPQLRFINGMDPIFQYAKNPRSYWLTHYISKDLAAARNCGLIRCTPATDESTYEALKKDFAADYLFLTYRRNPKFIEYVKSEPWHYRQIYDNGKEVVFKLL